MALIMTIVHITLTLSIVCMGIVLLTFRIPLEILLIKCILGRHKHFFSINIAKFVFQQIYER